MCEAAPAIAAGSSGGGAHGSLRMRCEVLEADQEAEEFRRRAAHEQKGHGPDQPPTKAHQFRARCTASGSTPIQIIGLLPLARSTHVQKRATSCIFAVRTRRHFPSILHDRSSQTISMPVSAGPA
jgi:hypothetical protein